MLNVKYQIFLMKYQIKLKYQKIKKPTFLNFANFAICTNLTRLMYKSDPFRSTTVVAADKGCKGKSIAEDPLSPTIFLIIFQQFSHIRTQTKCKKITKIRTSEIGVSEFLLIKRIKKFISLIS